MNSISFPQWDEPINVAIVGAHGGIGNALSESFYGHLQVKNLFRISRSPCDLLENYDSNFKTQVEDFKLDYESSISTNDQLKNLTQLKLPIHLLIIASGFLHQGIRGPEKKLDQLSEDFFLKNMRINALGPLEVIQALKPQLVGSHMSLIVVLSAKVGSIEDNQIGGWYSYRASKAALNMLLKTTSLEWKRYRESAVITIHPGTVHTSLSAPFTNSLTHLQVRPPIKAAEEILYLISKLAVKDNGRFLDYRGETLPW